MWWNVNIIKQNSKYNICVESKITKKTCHSVERQTELLGLIHTDLADLKQTMSRGVLLQL